MSAPDWREVAPDWWRLDARGLVLQVDASGPRALWWIHRVHSMTGRPYAQGCMCHNESAVDAQVRALDEARKIAQDDLAHWVDARDAALS